MHAGEWVETRKGKKKKTEKKERNRGNGKRISRCSSSLFVVELGKGADRIKMRGGCPHAN